MLRLQYFPLRARSWAAIVTAAIGKVPLTIDTNTANYKTESAFGQLPMLHVGDSHKIAQSVAIVNAIAKRGNILGDNDVQFDTSQMLVQEYTDLYDVLRFAKNGFNSSWKDAIETHLPRHAGHLEKLLRDDGTFTGKYLVGEACIFAALCLALDVSPSMLEPFPKLKKFFETMKAKPELQEPLKTYYSWNPYFRVQ